MKELEVEIVVLGSGPGGYTAAFRSADLLKKEGKKVALIEKYSTLGGVCLNVGCIPSKALLHVGEVMRESEHLADFGINLGSSKKKIDLDKLRQHKDSVVKQLTGGLTALSKKRKVEVIRGVGKFETSHSLIVDQNGETMRVKFKKAIIAVGSRVIKLPFLPDDDRIVDSTGALELRFIPKKMLIIGGGIIGMEMASVYASLGAEITIVEMGDQVMPAADKDLVQPLLKFCKNEYKHIYLKTRVTGVKAQKNGLLVSFDGDQAPDKEQKYDMILSAVGRRPNGDQVDIENSGIALNQRGFIEVNQQMQTSVPHIFAIGDCCGDPMLAHKAVPEGKVAAEVACGHKSAFTPLVIPSVAYTDPEVAWVGKTEKELKEQGIEYKKGVFPWAANGRSLALGRNEGLTKIMFCPKTNKIHGAGIVGSHAGDLIGEIGLAIEMGCVAEDIALTVHPHPTLIETVAQACEAYEGTITDLMPS